MNIEKRGGSESMPAMALRGMVLFPGNIMHFDVGRDQSIRAVESALESGSNLFVVAQRDVRVDDPTSDDLYEYGTVARVKQLLKMPDDGVKVLARGLYRARAVELQAGGEMLQATVERSDLPQPRRITPTLIANVRAAKQLFEEYVGAGNKGTPKEVILGVLGEQDPGRLVEQICQSANLPYESKQEILEQRTVSRQVEKLVIALEREINVLLIEKDIYDKVRVQLDQNQREYVLREQMHIISEELGEDGDDGELEELQKKIQALELPQETREHFEKNLNRLAKMPQGSQEGSVIQTYLETCLELPWNTYSKVSANLQTASKILERDHYGLKKVKERILEFIAVSKLAPKNSGQILCLVGPPGVGKTSIVKSIAESMGRKYVRISLGGVRDESEIRGHRKTYIGSMPGRIVKAMAQAKTQNPLILLDEVDKLGNDYKGDPSSALLEVLDKEQNQAFRDHYIEVPYDLSDVLFITSANDAAAIPAPLYDRMEVIELGSYTDVEKYNIAKRHLIPKQMKAHGLEAGQLKISRDAVFELIDGYTREAGVRSLEREIAGLCRKAAKEVVAGEKGLSVTKANLSRLIGHRRFDREDASLENKVGTVTGLAWTSVGGTTLPMEAVVLEGSGKIEITGSLGDVMQESAKIAVSYVRSIADLYDIPHNFYKNRDIHIHAPQGAIPKDGPSAGVTMVTALVSALTERPVRGEVAMTGEIDLHGNVLPIGGLKEKSMAAYKNGCTTVLIPKRNLPDLEEVDQEVKDHLHFVPVETISQVLETALVKPAAQPPEEVEELPSAPPRKKAGPARPRDTHIQQ
nr:endopeptidase La [Bittarella massiliensis (ex Durand et al. 2017)]